MLLILRERRGVVLDMLRMEQVTLWGSARIDAVKFEEAAMRVSKLRLQMHQKVMPISV